MPFYVVLQSGSTWIPEDCSQLCQCNGGSLTCSEYSCHQYAECSVRNGIRDCYCKPGFRGDGQDCERGE